MTPRTLRLAAALAAPLLALSSCSAQPTQPTPSAVASASGGSDVLERLGLADADAVTLVNTLDRSTDARPLDLKASVKANEVVLTDGAGERILPLPADKFYLSIAPYRETTHECFAHSLSGCQGEQVNKQVKLTITDQQGKKLVDKQTSTATNGFVGVWLPRDISGTVTATIDGRTGTVPFATTADSPTCLTTLQLR
ncbi:CueP family metal-binding protein [Luteococcus sp. H138]|uniref:CueP family metal-binding protein n=1 Tax=unclassified Luteococcus TaxID=2639923 RepID=UPI00313F390E